MATSQPPPPPLPPPNFISALSESKRIINAHSRHFLALSVLFLLPLSFSIVVYPTIQHQLLNPINKPHHNYKTSLSYNHDENPPLSFSFKFILVLLFYSVFAFVLSLLAIGSITYSVYHGFYGRPVKLISAVKSLFTSFLPLLATTLACQFVFYAVFVVFGLVLFAAVKWIQHLGYRVSDSPYFIMFCMMPVLLVLLLLIVYLQVNWSLISVIVVVESSWGCEPLKRSNALIKGMRIVALWSLLFFGFVGLVSGWTSVIWDSKLGGVNSNGDRWRNWGFVVQIVVTCTLFVLLMLYSLAVNTVLYMYCKAVHGELATEIAEEFAREYVSLPFDDGKVPHVVSVAYT